MASVWHCQATAQLVRTEWKLYVHESNRIFFFSLLFGSFTTSSASGGGCVRARVPSPHAFMHERASEKTRTEHYLSQKWFAAATATISQVVAEDAKIRRCRQARALNFNSIQFLFRFVVCPLDTFAFACMTQSCVEWWHFDSISRPFDFLFAQTQTFRFI